MSIHDAPTPNPEANTETAASLVKRFATLEKEFRELKRDFSQHKEIDFDVLEDRVDKHDIVLDDLKRLIVSHQTTNGLILQSIDRSMRTLADEMRAMRHDKTIVTSVTVVPSE